MNNLKSIIGISILLISNPVSAADIVYPKTQSVIINSPVTFFVGSENPSIDLKINDEPVKIHKSGGFYHPVKLSEGENLFIINNGKDIKKYRITRQKVASAEAEQNNVINYDNIQVFATKADNVPLRVDPFDGGINRLQHIEKGIPLNIVGEYNDFYKVQLARDDYAWIAKNHLTSISGYNNSPAKIENYIYEETPDKRTFTLKLNKKVPYILSETRQYIMKNEDFIYHTNGLDLTVYNIEDLPEGKFDFHINKTGKLFGYKCYYKNSRELVIEVKNYPNIDKSKPLEGIKITLDPGHGGDEYGAVGCLGDKEKDVNLAISLKLKKYLEDLGAIVYMTRETDIEVSLSERVKASQNNNSDIFISIHNNALPDSAAESGRSGSSVYYYYPQSKNLAEKILKSLTCELCMNNDKVRQESFAVVRNTESPAVLLEIGYMINPEDNAKLIDEDFQNKAAQAILHGVENYLNDSE